MSVRGYLNGELRTRYQPGGVTSAEAFDQLPKPIQL
jgi:hypothetical protein